MKTKLFVLLGIVLIFVATLGELHATKQENGMLTQQSLQLATDLESVTLKQKQTLERLEQERILNERLAIERDKAFESIDNQSRALKNAMYKLSQKDDDVKKWTNTSIPISVAKLLNRRAPNYHENRNEDSQSISI